MEEQRHKDTVYGKLEVPKFKLDENNEAEALEEIKWTIEEFNELDEFKIDKLYSILLSSILKFMEDDYDFESLLIKENKEEDILKAAQWAKKRIEQCSELTLMQAFYKFIQFYLDFNSYRQSLKKNV
jgi:hypothetical protein